jgi:hypothetical protein
MKPLRPPAAENFIVLPGDILLLKNYSNVLYALSYTLFSPELIEGYIFAFRVIQPRNAVRVSEHLKILS